MTDRTHRRRTAALAGVVAVAGCIAAWFLVPEATRFGLHESMFDDLLIWSAALGPSRAAAGPPIVIVDIDSSSLSRYGPWPWRRETVARLVKAVVDRAPAVIAVDILFAAPETSSPAALARRLGALARRPDIAALADDLDDDDQSLAHAVESGPVVLGFALDPDHAASVAGAPVQLHGTVAFAGLWRGAGAIAPPDVLLDAAKGIGALPFPGDPDGIVRRVPLFVLAGEDLRPGLALEALRLLHGATQYRIDADPRRLVWSDTARLPLPDDGLLRLVPASTDRAFPVTAAAALLAGPSAGRYPPGTIVLIGSSAPEVGGLRATPGDPLTPSVAIHAAALRQMAESIVPRSPPHAAALATMLGLGLAVLGIAVAAGLTPRRGTACVAAALTTLWLAALAAAGAGWLVDPAPPTGLAAIGFVVTSLNLAAATRQLEARIRRRFEQHLAPQVVAMIAARPDSLKLDGERREITALFTDIERFTELTGRAEPADLVTILDGYFEGVSRIVIDHGGMTDKFVGDAVHALFGAPLDQPGHACAAVACAIAISTWTEGYRQTALPAALGLGRTRIGLETGLAIVGDIGLRSKLDYTAHGDAVNTAARLEAANKVLGSAICVGPVAASRCPPDWLRPTGFLVPRGMTTRLQTFEPWPPGSDDAWRSAYRAAFALAIDQPAQATSHWTDLLRHRPDDTVVRTLIDGARPGPRGRD